MKLLIILLCLISINSFSQVEEPIYKELEKELVTRGREGGGGDTTEIEIHTVKNMIKNNILKIEKFFREDKVAQDHFPEVYHQVLSALVNEIIEGDNIKIVKDGDPENDNEEKTRIHDKYGIARTAVNYPGSLEIEYDLEEAKKLENMPKELFVLNFHELLGLMGLESNDPNRPDLYMNYAISGRLAKFVTKVESYDLDSSQTAKKKKYGSSDFYRFYLELELLHFKPKVCSAPIGNALESFEVIEDGSKDLCAYLKSHPVAKDSRNGHCETLYHVAIKANNMSALNCLDELSYGPQSHIAVNQKDKKLGVSFFDYALRYGNLQTIKHLKFQGGKYENPNDEFIAIVSRRKEIELLNFYLDLKVNLEYIPDDNSTTPLFWAMKNRNKDYVDKLIDVGADVLAKSGRNETTLMFALVYGFSNEFVYKLIDMGVDVLAKDKRDQSALGFAISVLRDSELIEKLIQLGNDVNNVNKSGWTPLAIASGRFSEKRENDILRNIDVLIRKGALINKGSMPPIHAALVSAVMVGNLNSDFTYNVIKHLLSLGADKNLKNSISVPKNLEENLIEKNMTAFDIAVQFKFSKRIKKLLF